MPQEHDIMPQEHDDHFPPLPPSNFNRDDLLQWLAEQTVSAQKLITGSLQADQEISSSNFSSGSAGWQIDGDGNAEFNDVTVRGDIISSNYVNGTSGYFLDSSAGSADFEGDVTVGGDIILTSGGLFKSANSGERLVVTNTSTGLIKFYSSSTEVGRIGVDSSTFNNDDIVFNHISSFGSGSGFYFAENGSTRMSLVNSGETPQLRVPSGFFDDFSLNKPGLSFYDDVDTGIGRVGSNSLALVAGGVNKMTLGTQVRSETIANDTTGSAANMRIDSTTGRMQRSTSARRYKSRITYNVDYLANIELKPTKFYRKDDHRWYYGMIADDLADQDPLLGSYADDGTIENYDDRELMAVMAAKINRLEERVEALVAQ